jgi:hypothetical protein
MLFFLIPVIILAGATSVGIAAEIAQSSPPQSAPTVQAESRPTPPAQPPRTP